MNTIKTLFIFLFVTTLLGCGGGSGGNSPPIFPAPKPVLGTSYENKNDILLDTPFVTALSGANGKTVTFGDFFQEGEYSAFVTVNAGSNNEARFLKKNGNTWTDYTVNLIATPSNRGVCGSVAQALTADFNADGKPDVFLVCGMSTGSEQQIIMSQSGGTSYVRQSVKDSTGQAIQLQGWGAAAADIDGDGDIDVVMAQNNEIVALENKLNTNGYWELHSIGNGNAWIDLSSRTDFPTLPRKVFLIPSSGARPDLVIGGDGTVGNITFAWLRSLNTSSAPYYRFTQRSADSSYADAYQMTNLSSASIYDVVKKSTKFIVLGKDQNISRESTASQMVVLTYNTSNLTTGVPTTYSGNTAPNFISQFKLNSAGQLVAYDGACAGGETRCSFVASP
jgi:hypothetical protein